MSFMYPLGLLGLIGVPILILIYIIKSKYTEQTIASTYLWTLSEKFLKRKNPISKLTGIISLILQILAVVLTSLAIAHPIFTIPNSANEYCFILDASGSMNMKNGDSTNFELAKKEIKDKIKSSIDGSIFTLVYAGDTTSVIYEKTEDKDQAIELLEELKVGHSEVNTADVIGKAQGYFNNNPSVLTYFVTDTTYEKVTNLEVVNVSTNDNNCGLSDVYYVTEGNKLTVLGKVTSYKKDTNVKLNLYMDGQNTPSNTLDVALKANEPSVFEFELTTDTFSSIEVKIDGKDALALDDAYIIYDVKSELSYKALIVSERPFFIEASLKSISNAPIDVLDPKDYNGQSGYGLYIFDSVDPEKLTNLPKDGAIWLINISGSVPDSGFTVQGEVTFAGAESLTATTSSSSTARALMQGLIGNDIYLKRYIKCGYYRNFTTVFSYQGNPVVFVGTNTQGNREVVLAFDIHDSNLPLLYDYAVLMRNMVDYSFPNVVEDTTYECGENAEVDVIANCQSIRVESPLGNVSYLDTNVATANLKLTEVGVYKVIMTVAGTPREFCIFSSMSEKERVPQRTEESIALQGEAANDGFDGRYDPLMIIFIVLAVVITADWMVYCYEKYQLR